SCSSTSDNNTGGDSNTQTQTITPELRETVNLSGALTDIYDSTGAQNANQKIAADIKENHLGDVFTNGEALSQVSDLTVTVNGNFSRDSWAGLTFNGETGNWEDSANNQNNITIAEANKLVYTSESEQIDIESLNDLHEKLSVRDTLKTALENAGVAQIPETTTLAINNNLGFTNGDLLHVNVSATPTGSNPTITNYDLQIPVSNLNLVVPNLTITVSGTNVGEANRTTTNFNFNIGINDTVSETDEKGELAADNRSANEALVALGLATSSTDSGNTTYTIDNDAVSAVVGVYNCNFASPTIQAVDESAGTYTITLQATPLDGYV
ncbi:hypothetical protein D8X55_05080, partial [Malacoplasma penetrans]